MCPDTTPHFSPYIVHRLRQLHRLLEQLQPETPPQALLVPGSPQPVGDCIVFPGSFNPPTTAHLALMKQARQYTKQMLSQKNPEQTSATPLLFAAFSKRTVDKEHVERPLLLDRILLLETLLRHRLAQAGIILFNRGLYVEQAQAIRTTFPRVRRLYFLLGFDKIVQILDPRYYKDRDAALHELFSLAELLVAPRGDAGEGTLEELLAQAENQQYIPFIHPLPFNSLYRDISSTNVRKEGEAHSSEVPQEVRQFLRSTRAYAPPVRCANGNQINVYEERVKTIARLLQSSTDL